MMQSSIKDSRPVAHPAEDRSKPFFSPRISRLRTRLDRSHAEALSRFGGRRFFDAHELSVYSRAILRAYRETQGQPAILRRVRALECFAEDAWIDVDPDDLLAGSQKFSSGGLDPEIRDEICSLGYAGNAGHIVHDYAALLDAGVDGLIVRIRASRGTDPENAAGIVLDAFERAMNALARYIERHTESATTLAASLEGAPAREWESRAADLRLISRLPPITFAQALQLVWFAQVFLHAENPSAAISFGRADQYLWPYLRRDLDQRRITWDAATELVAAFCLRCCEGDESQNLAVGGVDAEGRDATNPLSLLLVSVVKELRAFQPSLTIRMHPSAPPALVDAACALAVAGTGQPGFINDAAVIPGLMELGIPLARARDYAIVGCYEATTQGDCYPNTVAGTVPVLSKVLVDYMRTTAAGHAADFRQFLEGYLSHVSAEYRSAVANGYQNAWNRWRDHAPSPFGSVLMRDCIERALPLECGGAPFNLFGVNILGLGTTVDSLHVIRQLVFERHDLSLMALTAALDGDFADDALRQRLLSVPGRYGTDTPDTNRLTAEVSERVARMVLDSRMEHGVRPYPGFFRWTGDIWDHPYATPDGRRAADNLSYGCGPSSVCGGSPTSILASVQYVAHHLCACGNPLAISLQARDICGWAGHDRLKALVLGYFAGGGFHVHFNLLSPDELRKAQASPGQYNDLVIRISGLSAKFVALPGQLQKTLIERAEAGV